MTVAQPLADRARAAAELVRAHDGRTWTVVHHIDADGVSSGAIALEALHRTGIDALPLHVKSLDDHNLGLVREAKPEAVWACDLGSAVHALLPDVPKVVCDHHELVRDGGEDFQGHVNPMLDDLPGTEVSGAGAAFLVADALVDATDLLPMALVGAAADLQDRHTSRFEGSNGSFLERGRQEGLLDSSTDLAFYGPATRDLVAYLAYAREYNVPGVTNDRRGAQQFLGTLGIDQVVGGRARSWLDLDESERRAVRSALVERVLDCGLPADGLWREVVTLRNEAAGSPTRELQEFGTLLNATARYDRPDVGLAVARGDRDATFQEALGLRDGHRQHLAASLDVLARCGFHEMTRLQWVHARDMVRDTVIGIVCGMALGGLELRQDLALVGFAHTSDGRTKVSARASSMLQARGIDLAAAMRAGAEAVGGQGGGHKGAAGATIPRGVEQAFLEAVDAALAKRPVDRAQDSTVGPLNIK